MPKNRHKEKNKDLFKASSLSFDDWVEYFRVDMPDIDWQSNSLDLITKMIKLLRSADYLVERYNLDELNQLLWKFVGESGFFQVLYDERLPLETRLECVRAIRDLFKDLFAVQCSHFLSNGVVEIPVDISALNSICYMWWDLFCASPTTNTIDQKKIELSILSLLEELLAIEHIAIQESALHGLGHRQVCFPEEVESAVDRFLSTNKNLPEKLLGYAQSARSGCVN